MSIMVLSITYALAGFLTSLAGRMYKDNKVVGVALFALAATVFVAGIAIRMRWIF